MKTFITFLLISVLFAISTYAMADASASTHSYFEQVRANSFPDTTNKHQLLDQVKKRGYVRVIVKYNMEYTQEGKLGNDAQKNAQRQSISQMHDTFLEDIKELNASTVKRMKLSPLLALTVDEEALKYLYRSPLIERIYIDRASKAFLSKSISIVKADDTWEGFTITGSSTKIVIIDSGVDAGHEMLSGKVIDGACFNTNDQNLNISTLCPNAAESDYGVAAGEDCGSTTGCDHGTHVAGIAAGNSVSYYNDSYSGVAKEAKIISIQVFSKYGNDLDCEDTDGDGVGDAPCIASQLSDQISALEWIYTQYGNDNSVAAVNMSLGDGEYTSVCDTDPRKDAIDNLSINGIITIAASGNENNSNALSAPACISSVISVGATNDQDTHWSESGNEGSNAASFLDLVAPGVSIISSVPGNNQYASFTGSSMALPHVAGTIALMKEAYPNQLTSQYRTILQNTADDVDAMFPYSFTDEYGHGRLNTFEAVTQSLINNPSVYVYDYSHTLSPGEEFLDETIIILDGNSLTVNVDLSLTNTTLYIHGTLEGSGTIYLYGNSEIVERLGGENNFQGNVVTSDAYPIIVRNNFGGYQGGQVGVGKNVSPVNRTSPHQELVSNGDTLNLEAYDNQNYDGHTWIFNNTEGTEDKSQWFIEQGSSINPINDSFDQSPSIEVDENEGAEIFNEQKRIFTISRNDYSPEADNTFNTANVQVVEGNTLTAPSTQTVNGTTYTFFEWSDGVTENPRTIDSPTSSLTAHYKVFNATSSINVMGTDQRRKIVEHLQHNKVYRVYESGGQLWYQWRDRNTNTWSYEKRIQTPADGLYDVQNPSIAISDGRLWVVYEYYDGSLTWLANTKIVDPSGASPSMAHYNIDFFMGQNSIKNVSTSGIQNTSQPYESYSRGVIFVSAYSDMGILVPIVYAFSETSSGWINVSYSSNLHFLSNGRQPVDVSGGISAVTNSNAIGFTWSDGSEVYFNHGYFDTNTRTIEANILATEVVSSYNPQFSGSTDPTISADGGAFSVAFPTLWNSTSAGPINIVAETEVTSQATDLTMYTALDGYSDPEFSAPMLSKDISSATSTDGYLVAKQNDNIKLFEKTSGNWIKFNQFGNVGRSASEYVTESGMIGSYSSPVGGTSLSEIKEFEAYDGTNFKMNDATVSSMISAHWESQRADSVFHEFWLGEIGVEDEILPIEISGSDKYEITLTKPFILDSKSVRISYNHTEKNIEIPLTIAAFDTSGNRIQEWTPQLHTSLRHANVMENYSEAISEFTTEILPLNEEASKIPVVLKLVAKDSTKMRWLQIGVDGFQGKKKQYNQDDTAPINRDIPDDFNLLSNYPNPFNPTTNIVYELPQQSDVTITVYNITGKVVAVYNEGLKPAGSHRITFNASNLSSGIYIYKLQAGEFSSTRKMLLIK